MNSPSARAGAPSLGSVLPRFLVVAVIVLALAAGLGALSGFRRGLDEVDAQGYAELGFERGRHAALVAATDHGALGGAEAVWPWVLCALVLVASSSAVRGLLSPTALAARLADPLARLRFQVLWSVLFVAGSAYLAARTEPLLTAEWAWLGLLAAGCVVAIEVAGRMAREPARHATLAAAVGTLLPLALVLFEVDRRRVYRPTASDTLLANAGWLVAAGLSFVVLRAWASRGRPPLAARALVGLLATSVATPAVVRVLYPEPTSPAIGAKQPFNVVVIGIDTLRADHTDLVGDDRAGSNLAGSNLAGSSLARRDRTPALRALAARGSVFTNAITQSPWTMPAFASILTGKYPLEHGAVSLSGKLRARELTLAELLRETGRATAAFVSHDYVDHKHGFAQGFDEFDDSCAEGHATISSPRITDLALDFVARHAEQPFFLFTHYFDPHYEYKDHAEWSYADDYDGWLEKQLDFENLEANRHLMGAPELDYVRDLYDEEISFTDREIGRLVAEFERRGLFERTLFVVVADHGEEFMEHGNFGHTTTLHDELLNVPLVVVAPPSAGFAAPASVFEHVVETRQVFATVLAGIGVDFPPVAGGRSLFADGATPHPAYSMVWLPDALPKWGKRFQIASLRTERFKLVKDLTRGVTRLYDLEIDAGETRDASGAAPERRAELELALDAWIGEMQKRAGEVPLLEIDEATRTRLHELGYM
ncbi:MAG: sulfatase [Planctomycetes bacterium]|nr:sulfatase [Planctomycetota bacterium]